MTEENNEQKQQELMYRMMMFEQQIGQIQQQIQAVEQGIAELEMLSNGLNDLKRKTGSEILAPLGKGIFAKAKLISEDLLVDVGEKNFVTKSIPETQKLLQEQVGKLEKAREDLEKAKEEVEGEVKGIVG